MRIPTLITAFATSLLVACASSGGLQTQARPLTADRLATTRSLSSATLSVAAWPRQDWWAAFGDAQLDRLIVAALQGQPGLRIAEARVHQAQAAADRVDSSLSPQVSAGISSTPQQFSENSIVPKPLAGHWNSMNSASLGVSYELDFWGKNQAAVDAALDRAHSAEVDLQAARLILTATVARTYIRLDAAYAQLDLANDMLQQRESTLTLTRQRVAAQIDSELELTQAEAALPALRERIAAIGESITLLDNQIAALEGLGPDAGLDIRRPRLSAAGPVQIPADLPAELLGHRPDVVAERWRVEAARKDVKVAKAQFYPNVSLNAFVGLQSLGLSDFFDYGSRVAGIGPAVSLPVFDGGRLRSNLDAHQAAYDAEVEQYNVTLIAAVHDVVDQMVSQQWLQQQMQQQDEALRLARHACDLAQARYRSGLANYLQVLSTQAQVLAQQQHRIELQARQRELQLNLIRALGGGYVSSPGPDTGSQSNPSIGERS
jgi:NodT family efflux transporter outer membrane factor (OMF) lipoprotein